MSEECHFNPAQREALEHAYEKLGEQFDGVLIVVMAEVAPITAEETQESVRCFYAGGRTLAVGLAAEAQHVLQNQTESDPEP